MSVKSNLPQIASKLQGVVDDAAERGADAIAADAKQRVAVNSGALRDAIHVERVHDGYAVVAGDAKAWYGHLVENGTVKTAPHPFLVPALEENRGQIVSQARAGLKAL